MACFTANTNKSFTLYYNLLEYFRVIMTNHPSLNRVTQGDVFSVDTDEYPTYPIGNILVTNTAFNDKNTVFTCQLTVADKVKLKNNESVGERNEDIIAFYGTDDVVDIHTNTLNILNDLISFTQLSPTTDAFEISTVINCVPFRDNFDNGLAGWVATFELVTHNNRDRCLYNLLGDC